jgi:hypothetical protein
MVCLKTLKVEQILLNHHYTSHQLYSFTSQSFTMLPAYTDEKDERALSAGPLELEPFLTSPSPRYTNKRTASNATNPTIGFSLSFSLSLSISLLLCPSLSLVYSMQHSPS